MSDLKDHLWSVSAGFVGCGVAAGGIMAATSAGFSAVSGGVAFFSSIVGGLVASGISRQADKFKPTYCVGGAALSLAAVFSTANHFGLFEKPGNPEQTGQESVPASILNENHRADAAQAFNETNTDGNVVEASVDGQGHYVLTVKAPKPAL